MINVVCIHVIISTPMKTENEFYFSMVPVTEFWIQGLM